MNLKFTATRARRIKAYLIAYFAKQELKSNLRVDFVANASLRNVRKNLDVGMIATVLQMPISVCLVLRVKRKVNNSKTSSPRIKIAVAYVYVTTQTNHV